MKTNEYISGFDIFDTVVVRSVGHPVTVFRLLGFDLAVKRLIIVSPEKFAEARGQAEALAHRQFSHGTKISHIYRYLPDEYFTSASAKQLSQIAEEELEASLLRVVPQTMEALSKARACGQSVVFISDMYLTRTVLQNILTRLQVATADDLVLVSCEEGTNKTENLFRVALDRLNIKPEQLNFTGNNYKADVCSAARYQIPAKHFYPGNLTQQEESLSQLNPSIGLDLFAGAARITRLATAKQHKPSALSNFVTTVAGPLLCSFVGWALQQAKENQINTLYFLSRDGEVLLKIAKELGPQIHPNCRFKYLYASRKAWGIATLDKINKEELTWVLTTDPAKNLKQLLHRLNLPYAKTKRSLSSISFDEVSWEDKFTQKDRDLLSSKDFLDLIAPQLENSKRQQGELLAQYLNQMGINQDTAYGIVDLGWHGSLQKALTRFCQLRNLKTPEGYYFGLFDNHPPKDKRHSFLISSSNCIPFPLPDLYYFLESLCAGTEGSLSCYQAVESKVVPVLSSNPANQLKWDVVEFQELVRGFAQNLVIPKNTPTRQIFNPDNALCIMNHFWFQPCVESVQLFKKAPFEGGMDNDADSWSCVAPLTFKDCLKSVLVGRVCPPAPAFWVAGSICLSPKPYRPLLHFLQTIGPLYHYPLRKLYRWSKLFLQRNSSHD